ncbi:MAG TPA: signal recognition particle-docking protein FtsY [archaeon]|nr:signal recognition particle-docking protein FtsY [archaeon]
MLGFLRKKIQRIFGGAEESPVTPEAKKIQPEAGKHKPANKPVAKGRTSPKPGRPAKAEEGQPARVSKSEVARPEQLAKPRGTGLFVNQQKLLEDLETGLLECGVAFEVVDILLAGVREVKPREAKARLRKDLLALLKPAEIPARLPARPYVILIAGINGTGKTTTVAKLARYFLDRKKSVVVAAADTFRAAAIEQLREHCNRLGVRMIEHQYGSDPAAVAFDAVRHAEAKKVDVVLIDTSGRLHVDAGLMRELEKVKRVVKPHLSLLTIDATTGNDAVEQARAFDPLIDGVVLTKFDVDERGGALISVSAVTGKPVYFLAAGQAYGDLEPLEPRKIIDAMGL